MRCKACDKRLNDKELTLKDSQGEFYDLCYGCLSVHWETKAELEDTYDHGVYTSEDQLQTEESSQKEYGYDS